MQSESLIFSDFQEVSSQLPGSTPLLIREGRIFSYYRIEIDGKYFFFKTVKDTNNIGLLLLRKEYDIGCSATVLISLTYFFMGNS